jgi:hypothetical protein
MCLHLHATNIKAEHEDVQTIGLALSITELRSTVRPHDGKVRRALRAALKAQPLPEPDFSKSPKASWN